MLVATHAYYIIDNQKVYTWKGKQCPRDVRKKILTDLDAFLKKIKFEGTYAVEALSGGTETAPFKQLFADWQNTGQTVGIGVAYNENSYGKKN